MRRKHLTRTRIPLDNLTKEERDVIKEEIGGKYKVVVVDEPCLTCGHKTRVQHVEKTDGKREIVQECLYCMCKHHTEKNKGAP